MHPHMPPDTAVLFFKLLSKRGGLSFPSSHLAFFQRFFLSILIKKVRDKIFFVMSQGTAEERHCARAEGLSSIDFTENSPSDGCDH